MAYILYKTKTWNSDTGMWHQEEDIVVPIDEDAERNFFNELRFFYNGEELSKT